MNRTRELIQKYGIRAKKKFGQNFLVDDNVIEKIIAAVDDSDRILEIGPGLGCLTQKLVNKCSELTVYEIDQELTQILINEYDGFEVVNEDFLNVDINHECNVVSNLPYYITSDLLMKLFRNGNKVKEIIVMVQKEFADRIQTENSPIKIISESYYDLTVVTKVSKNCFIPAPNVDSIVLKLVKNDVEVDEAFIKFIEDCFENKRKVLLKNLVNLGYKIDEAKFEELGLDKNVRCEQLNKEIFWKLYEAVK